jgi:hypothetical protein
VSAREAGEAGRESGKDAERDAVLDQREGFLAAAPEDEGIAALEPQHALAFAGEPDDERRDVVLMGRGLAAPLAGEMHFGRLGGTEDRGVDQRVVDDGIGLGEGGGDVERDLPGIARARARQPDMTRLEDGEGGASRAMVLSRLMRRSINHGMPESGPIGRLRKPAHGCAARVLMPRAPGTGAGRLRRRARSREILGAEPLPHEDDRGALDGVGRDQRLDRGQRAAQDALVRPAGMATMATGQSAP